MVSKPERAVGEKGTWIVCRWGSKLGAQASRLLRRLSDL